MLVTFNHSIYAQSLTVINNTSCGPAYNVTIYAQSGTMNSSLPPMTCPASCNEIAGYTFTIGASTTLYWCDPLDFVTGYCSGTLPDPGYSSIECGYYASIAGYLCSTSNPWPPCVPGWTWTYAVLDNGCLNSMHYVCMAGNVGNGICASSTLYGSGSPGCSSTLNAIWTNSGSNVTITINP